MFSLRLLPLFLIGTGLLAGCSRPEPSPEPVRAVRTMMVAPATVSPVHEYAAEIRARVESRLAFRVGGKLVRRQAQVGQVVAAGQVLAELDPEDLRLAQAAAQAAVTAADVSANQARDDLARFKSLQAQGFISAAELERRSTTLRAAEAQLVQARAQAAAQVNQVDYSQLLAPAAGVVLSTDAEPGTVLAAGTPVLRLAHAGARDVVFAVPEDRVVALRTWLGQTGVLQVQLWGRPGFLPATLREVAVAADPTTRTFLAKADLGAAPVDLGQTAAVSVPLPSQGGVLRLPLSALTEQQGRTVVWLLDPAAMTVRAQPVQVAGADVNSAVIAAGLSPGAEVVTAGVHVLTEGQKVTRYIEPKAAAK
jgi:RND family efflux transporter MFP subunit